MICLSSQFFIVCRGGDIMKLISLVFHWITRLFIKEKQPVSAQIQVVISNITILNIHKG